MIVNSLKTQKRCKTKNCYCYFCAATELYLKGCHGTWCSFCLGCKNGSHSKSNEKRQKCLVTDWVISFRRGYYKKSKGE